MKNRFYKFLVMLMTVMIVGSVTTMLNLRMQKKAVEEDSSMRPFAMMNSPQPNYEWQETRFQVQEETQASMLLEDKANVESYETMPEELSEETYPLEPPSESNLREEENVAEDAVDALIQQNVLTTDKDRYYARLQDMERVYVARMNAAAKETIAVQQKTADELLKIWDDELNDIYQKLRKTLSEDDFYTLRSEERAWIRNRDESANRAAAKETYSNSTQNLAYTRSLLQWTKERVYELVAMYYEQ